MPDRGTPDRGTPHTATTPDTATKDAPYTATLRQIWKHQNSKRFQFSLEKMVEFVTL